MGAFLEAGALCGDMDGLAQPHPKFKLHRSDSGGSVTPFAK